MHKKKVWRMAVRESCHGTGAENETQGCEGGTSVANSFPCKVAASTSRAPHIWHYIVSGYRMVWERNCNWNWEPSWCSSGASLLPLEMRWTGAYWPLPWPIISRRKKAYYRWQIALAQDLPGCSEVLNYFLRERNHSCELLFLTIKQVKLF